MQHACKHAGGPKLKTNRVDFSERQRDYHTDIDRDILDVFMGRGEGFLKSVQLTLSVTKSICVRPLNRMTTIKKQAKSK